MTTSLPPGLARKVKKVLEVKTESAEVLSSLSALSEFYTSNDAASRRKLRPTIEERGVGINLKFLEAADVLLKALDAVDADVSNLNAACGRIGSALKSSKAGTADMLSEVDRLQKSLESASLRSTLVEQFLQQYQLSAEEVEALQGENIDSQFFSALERVRHIHTNCRGLLRTHHQRAGLELMDAMAVYQEGAYERLCSWVQRQCSLLLKGSADVELPPMLPVAVAALRERPVLFQYCSQEVIATRRNAVLSALIIALTKGGPGGFPRPMEMHAHDARRYVGDMLAWVHQALANERELMMQLFGEERVQVHVPAVTHAASPLASPRASAAAETETTSTQDFLSLTDVLDQVFESVCKPLEVRIDSVLNSLPPPLICFKLSQLLTFYSGTIQGLLGAHAQLASSLRTASDRCKRLFSDQLKAKSERLLRYPPPPPRDLGPPVQVMETMQQLAELLSSFDASQNTVDDLGGSREGDFNPVIATVVDSLIQTCERSSEALVAESPARVDEGAHLDPAAPKVYLINCLTLIENNMTGQPALQDRVAHVSSALDGQTAALVGVEAGRILGSCGLNDMVERVRWYQEEGHNAGGAVSSDPALALPKVASALNTFCERLSDPTAFPEFEKIQVPRVRAMVSLRLMQQLVGAYELLHTALHDPNNGYDAAQVAVAVKHAPSDIRTILGVS